ncbi:MAG: ABC transporter permease [Isosphaeraceae bacterium]
MGRIWRGLKLGMKSLLLHKLRSGLTVLGIVFGVAAVIAMLAIAEGTSRDAKEQIRALGATNIIIRSVKPSDETLASSSGRPTMILNYGLKYSDYDRMVATIPTISKILPIREIRKQIRHGQYAMEGLVVGTTHEFADFNLLKMEKGRFLTASDNDTYQNYVVLGAEAAGSLFPYEDPLNQTVRLGSDYYTVIGVTARRASSTGTVNNPLSAKDFNKDVYIPLNTCKIRFGERIMDNRSGSRQAEETQLTQITIQVKTMEDVLPTVPLVQASYEKYHYKKDVEMIVPYDLLLSAERQARQFAIILGTIAAISLLVGGIGIMNIMLATVTERTREIGIRRALGAKQRDITQQFLIETIVLSGVGGLLGVAVGFIIPLLIVFFVQGQKAIVTGYSVMLSFGISVAVGILFGIYPARRAAMMDPIEALRHE